MKNNKPDLVHVFDQATQIIHLSLKTRARIGSETLTEKLGISKRAAQRYLKKLEKYGYLVGDDAVPKGYLPSDKAKQMFWVAV